MKNKIVFAFLTSLLMASAALSLAQEKGADISLASPVEITSVMWQGPKPGQSVNVTAHFKKIWRSGVPSVQATTKEVGEGKDPARLKPKTLVVKYSVNGEAKQLTCSEGQTFNFADLK